MREKGERIERETRGFEAGKTRWVSIPKVVV